MSPFLLLAALVPAVFLMVQVYRLDRIEKEPPGLLLKLVLFGTLSGLAAGVVEGALTRALEVLLSGSALRLVIENFLAVALVEEACKRWVVMKFAWNHPAFDYRFDAVVYCVFAALGFAALENILYVAQFGFAVAVSRALLSVPGHCFFCRVHGHLSRAGEDGRARDAAVLYRAARRDAGAVSARESARSDTAARLLGFQPQRGRRADDGAFLPVCSGILCRRLPQAAFCRRF